MKEEGKPGIFIPTLYFAEGLPYTIVMMMSGVFFKSMGADNIFIGLTSFLSLPWILKFAWSPLVDYYGTKRRWIVTAQIVLSVFTLAMAAVALMSSAGGLDHVTKIAIIALSFIALASATQDVAIDGYYLDALNEEQKAFYVGIRNAAYKIAWLFGSGAMVFLAGKLALTTSMGIGWAAAFAICAASMLVAGLFHSFYLPHPEKKISPEVSADAIAVKRSGPDFLHAIGTYFVQPRIVAIVIYILIFRLGDAMMLKQAPNFLLDPIAKGGLSISVADIGIINGTVGVIALLLGGIVGSWLISRHGLKRWMWPLTLLQNSAILLYWALAKWPDALAVHSSVATHWSVAGIVNPYLPAVYVVNSIEQFSYGMGVAAYTVFLLSTVRSGENKAAHYATATAMMALGMMIPGVISGFLYAKLGYANFFLVSFLASLPGIFAIFFLPLWHADKNSANVGSGGGHAVGISKAGQVGSESK